MITIGGVSSSRRVLISAGEAGMWQTKQGGCRAGV